VLVLAPWETLFGEPAYKASLLVMWVGHKTILRYIHTLDRKTMRPKTKFTNHVEVKAAPGLEDACGDNASR
jgi:hypothetical protein